MKITLLTNYDCASLLALSYLKPQLSQHQVNVFYTQKERKPATLSRPAALCQPVALSRLNTFEQSIVIRHQRFLESMNAQPMNDINGRDLDRFANTAPDLVLSIRHMSILKDRAISTPKLGVINLHSGALPDYQGVMATFWAMKNHSTKVGTTLHFVEDANIDTGSIIASSEDTARYDKSYFWNTLNIYQKGCANMLAALTSLHDGKQLIGNAQRGQGRYYSFPTEQDLANFKPELFSENDSLIEFMS